MAIEDALAKIPGLAGYLGTQQFQQEQQTGQLGQMGSLLKIHAAIKAQQEGDQIKSILAKSQDLQTALPELVKMGPSGILVAKHLAEVQQAQQDAAMNADVQKMIPKGQGR